MAQKFIEGDIRLQILITCQNPKMAQLFSSENPEMNQNSDNLCLEFHFSATFYSGF